MRPVLKASRAPGSPSAGSEETDVVAEAVERRLGAERFLEQRLRPVVLLLREVREPELEGDRGIGAVRARARSRNGVASAGWFLAISTTPMR